MTIAPPSRTCLALAAAALLLAGPLAAQSPSRLQQMKDSFVPAGEPVDCIVGSQVRDTRVLDNNTIDFFLQNNQVFRNNLPSSCPGLGAARAFQYTASTPRVCNVDTIRVFQQGPGPRFGATCPLGSFTPMKPAPGATDPATTP